MDIIESCLGLAPVPYLSTAVSILRHIHDHVLRAQISKLQLLDLEQGSAQLLFALNDAARSRSSPNTVYPESPQIEKLVRCVLTGFWCQGIIYSHMNDVCSLFREIAVFVQCEDEKHFLQLVFTKEFRIAKIQSYQRQMASLAEEFRVT
jgi:hypothetical protein